MTRSLPQGNISEEAELQVRVCQPALSRPQNRDAGERERVMSPELPFPTLTSHLPSVSRPDDTSFMTDSSGDGQAKAGRRKRPEW